MLIFPAVDLMNGQAVRLTRGEYTDKTVYRADPLDALKEFASMGAKQVHLVDLDGARDGGTPHFETVCRLKRETDLFCEIGGGIRDMRTVTRYLNAGLDRVILGTAALTDPVFLKKAVDVYGEKIAVGADLRDGFVAIRGWRETSQTTAEDFCRAMEEAGVQTLICTDISRDGALLGCNTELYRTLSENFTMRIVASGGVSSLDDVRALRKLDLYGAILGKAYYTGKVNLQEAIEAAR